jgi:hypothetical protein
LASALGSAGLAEKPRIFRMQTKKRVFAVRIGCVH